MKKTFSIIILFLGILTTTAQTYKPTKSKKNKTDDFSITVKEQEKDKINWNSFKEIFENKNDIDSVQISVKLLPIKDENIKSEKKYTVRGIKKNLDELVDLLKKMVNK